MDTNLVTTLLTLLSQQKAEAGGGLDNSGLLIASMVVNAVAPLLAALVIYIQSRGTSVTVKEIHTAVNSERTATLKLLEDLRQELLQTKTENAAMREQAKVQQIVTAASTGASPAAATIEAVKETTKAVKEVQEIVATDDSVSLLIQKLTAVLDTKKK